MPVVAPVRPRVAVFVTNPAKLTSWSLESVATTYEQPISQPPSLHAYYARMAATFRSRPPLAHHEHERLGEIDPF